ncbi:MAG: hypothetical protein HGA76_10000, partial [Candidatus Firestonebacteria bacterium]|nr:hypothetical protein [Candidatus Firestonebacteria bacterium]
QSEYDRITNVKLTVAKLDTPKGENFTVQDILKTIVQVQTNADGQTIRTVTQSTVLGEITVNVVLNNQGVVSVAGKTVEGELSSGQAAQLKTFRAQIAGGVTAEMLPTLTAVDLALSQYPPEAKTYVSLALAEAKQTGNAGLLLRAEVAMGNYEITHGEQAAAVARYQKIDQNLQAGVYTGEPIAIAQIALQIAGSLAGVKDKLQVSGSLELTFLQTAATQSRLVADLDTKLNLLSQVGALADHLKQAGMVTDIIQTLNSLPVSTVADAFKVADALRCVGSVQALSAARQMIATMAASPQFDALTGAQKLVAAQIFNQAEGTHKEVRSILGRITDADRAKFTAEQNFTLQFIYAKTSIEGSNEKLNFVRAAAPFAGTDQQKMTLVAMLAEDKKLSQTPATSTETGALIRQIANGDNGRTGIASEAAMMKLLSLNVQSDLKVDVMQRIMNASNKNDAVRLEALSLLMQNPATPSILGAVADQLRLFSSGQNPELLGQYVHVVQEAVFALGGVDKARVLGILNESIDVLTALPQAAQGADRLQKIRDILTSFPSAQSNREMRLTAADAKKMGGVVADWNGQRVIRVSLAGGGFRYYGVTSFLGMEKAPSEIPKNGTWNVQVDAQNKVVMAVSTSTLTVKGSQYKNMLVSFDDGMVTVSAKKEGRDYVAVYENADSKAGGLKLSYNRVANAANQLATEAFYRADGSHTVLNAYDKTGKLVTNAEGGNQILYTAEGQPQNLKGGKGGAKPTYECQTFALVFNLPPTTDGKSQTVKIIDYQFVEKSVSRGVTVTTVRNSSMQLLRETSVYSASSQKLKDGHVVHTSSSVRVVTYRNNVQVSVSVTPAKVTETWTEGKVHWTQTVGKETGTRNGTRLENGTRTLNLRGSDGQVKTIVQTLVGGRVMAQVEQGIGKETKKNSDGSISEFRGKETVKTMFAYDAKGVGHVTKVERDLTNLVETKKTVVGHVAVRPIPDPGEDLLNG